jgi:hypothetical protein
MKMQKSDYVTCQICKAKILRSRLLESLKLKKDGSYGVRGQCVECGHFVCWIPHSESYQYGHLYQIERRK